MSTALETPAELADRVGVPVANIRRLIRAGRLDHIYISPGRRNPKIPSGAWERYLDSFMVRAGNAPRDRRHETENSSEGKQP